MLKVKSLLANKIKLYSQSLVDNEQQQAQDTDRSEVGEGQATPEPSQPAKQPFQFRPRK